MEHIPGPAEFWQAINEAEAQRKEREKVTREMKARPQYRVASNDEPEPTRTPRLSAADLNAVEQQ